MSNPIGVGPSPLGVAAYGFGTPVEAPIPGGLVNRSPTGIQHGSPKLSLDPATKGQYVFDEFGRRVGMPNINHMVTLALATVRGSCVVPIGHRFREIRKVTDAYQQEQKTRVDEAFAPIVGGGFITVDAVLVEPRNGQPAVTRIFMTDVSSGKSFDETI